MFNQTLSILACLLLAAGCAPGMDAPLDGGMLDVMGDGPACDDGVRNGDEVGVDCGGACAACSMATCDDGIHNQDEMGVDCGGPCPACPSCPDGACGGFCPPCSTTPSCSDGVRNGEETAVDCGGGFCDACPVPATCMDGMRNGDETSTDCGGSCAACVVAPTCSDGEQNGDETGVDCGGSCPPCIVAPTCSDGEQNGAETGVDCGGPCAACPTCTDGARNGGETGVDCGGPCPACPTCSDGVRNGGETGVDCGGPCAVCRSYDEVVLADGPISYYQYIAVNTLYDVVGGRHGTTVGPVGSRAFGNSAATAMNNAPNFRTDSHISVPDNAAFSISTTGTLTIEYWLKPSTLTYDFSGAPPASSYVYALGKGHSGTYEYGMRFYSSDAVATRTNAISGYVWNTTGGLGSGATSRAGVTSTTRWTHFVVTYTNFGEHGPDTENNGNNAAAYPGIIRIWRNGVPLRFGYMSQFGIRPRNSSAPFQMGRRGRSDGPVTYAGAVGKVAIYNTSLTDAQVLRHYQTVYP